MRRTVVGVGLVAGVFSASLAFAEGRGPVVRAHDTVIRERAPRPIAAIEVPKAAPSLGLTAPQPPPSLRIAEAVGRDPF